MGVIAMIHQCVVVWVAHLVALSGPLSEQMVARISTTVDSRTRTMLDQPTASRMEPTPLSGRVIDVGRYGAKGDDITDDTAAIQAAVQALPPGGVLAFGKGVYRITRTLVVRAERATLQLGSSRLHVVGGVTAMQVSANGVTIYGGEIYSDGQAAGRGMYGIDLSAGHCVVDGTHIHDIHASGVVSRGENNVIRNLRVEDVGWDMGLCRGGSKQTIWQDCWCNNVGRSAVACDDNAENMQIVGCYALNPGNTQYVNQQHNVWHFETCNGGLVKDCTVQYTAEHDYCSHTDSGLKAVVARYNGQEVVVDGLTVLLDSGFATSATLSLILDYGSDAIPLRVSNVRVHNDTDVILRVALQSADMEWQDWSVYGGLAITQPGAASSVIRMQDLHIDGKNLPFDFYYQPYGYNSDGTITGCTFENIDGWAIKGHFNSWTITQNTFRNVDGIALLAQSNNFARKSNATVIADNLFDSCRNVLLVHGGTTAAAHNNSFRDNRISGQSQTLYRGSFAGTSVYWRGNTKAEDAAWTTLAVNNGFRLFDTLLSEYDALP